MNRGVLEQALDAMPAAVAVLDGTGSETYSNRLWHDLTRDESFHDFLGRAGASIVQGVNDGMQAVRSGMLPVFEQAYPVYLGTEARWFELKATAAAGFKDGLLLIHTDITERRLEQERLRASETNYREIFDKANDGVFIHDIRTGRMLDANFKLYEMYGYTAEEFKSIMVGAISADRPPYTQSDALKWIRKAARDEPQLFEWLAKDRNGRLFWVEVNLKRARIAGQERLLAIVRDITERKRAEDEVLRARRALSLGSHISTLGEVGASLAHELNQPLAAIMTNAQAALRMLACRGAEPTELREILGDIAADDERAAGMVRRMREPLSSKASDTQRLELNGLVEDMRLLLKADTLAAGAALDLYLAPDLPALRGDRIQLQQVVMNLVVNATEAARAMPPGQRRVTILTRREDGRSLRLQVEDSGLGLTQGELECIFEPFWTTKPNGLGLGLSISRTLVEAHGGRIFAENRPEGGARFVVVLPTEETADGEPAAWTRGDR
ncbi:MAG: PAS domain S-box protein [Gaiellales bacterium]|nr:PAS domain S-box protein [Gaiellales bacterium]